MHFYRRPGPLKAISFDLDDTLYDNVPVIAAAERAQLDFLRSNVEAAAELDRSYWMGVRKAMLAQDPELLHDVGALRIRVLTKGLGNLGVSNPAAIAEQAFDAFIQKRIQITISDDVMAMMETLSNHYPLVVLSNGNACVETMGLSHVFEFALHAGDNGLKQKPSADMFDEAAKRLKLPLNHIWHIGDHLRTDVRGALDHGCTAVWINPFNRQLEKPDAIPHLELQEVTDLVDAIPV